MEDTTVVIKTFERPQCLRRLLESIFRYYPDIKVVIADDSADPGKTKREVVGSWSGKKIECLELPYDVGLSAGRNWALAHVKTPYFVLCDDDFIFDRRTDLERMKRQLEERRKDLVAGMYFESFPIKTQGFVSRILEIFLGLLYDLGIRFSLPFRRVTCGNFEYDKHSRKTIFVRRRLKPGVTIAVDVAPNFFIAKTSIRNKVKWRPELKLAEHRIFFLDLKAKGFKCLVNPDVGVNHVRDTGWGSRYRGLRYREELKKWDSLNREILESGGGKLHE